MSQPKLLKFPFKAMIPIIEYLHSNRNKPENEFSIYDIQDASNACFPDTLEVVQMLSYLTAFGQVKEHENGWTIGIKQENPLKRMFRELFLKDILQVIEHLNQNPQQVENLSESIKGIKTQEIFEYLQFLQTITAYGFVKKFTNGWKLKEYSTSTSVEVSSN